jgi:hypothetical protein
MRSSVQSPFAPRRPASWRFCSTVSGAKTRRPWGTMATPARATWCARRPASSCPASLTEQASRRSSTASGSRRHRDRCPAVHGWTRNEHAGRGPRAGSSCRQLHRAAQVRLLPRGRTSCSRRGTRRPPRPSRSGSPSARRGRHIRAPATSSRQSRARWGSSATVAPCRASVASRPPLPLYSDAGWSEAEPATTPAV